MATKITKGIRVITKDGHAGTVTTDPALTPTGQVVKVQFDDPSVAAGGGADYSVTDLKPAPAVPARCECSRYSVLVNLRDEDGDLTWDEELTTGCTATTARVFAPGHDAKLKSALIRWGAEGHEVTREGDGVSTTADAATLASKFIFANMVAAGIKRAAAKAERAGARAAKVQPAAEVTAKVGRWDRVGTVQGDTFTYTDAKGATKTTKVFTLI
ncbi:hypothetical protein BCL76_10992 [Streptomyces sp. CG 926]|uniref:hypothetical protein n=1 Tax=Streptomyces sp. CG 926 TaxID=1882405 RepID=UPI000D7A5917|nr:hypothetical protein [Streptomyces sp. CG 926]PWK67187.1 hypothetical protein BCL76_10992 [Streptomyces sp. CG 926]